MRLPSWAFGNSGTRFKVFTTPGTPRDPYEKVADATQVHRYTGLVPTVALHIPWDLVDDFADLKRHAEEPGVRLGTVNSNTFRGLAVLHRAPDETFTVPNLLGSAPADAANPLLLRAPWRNSLERLPRVGLSCVPRLISLPE